MKNDNQNDSTIKKNVLHMTPLLIEFRQSHIYF